MNSGAHYVLPGSVRDIYREPRMAREHARFRGELLHVPNGLTTGRASGDMAGRVCPKYPRPVCVEEQLFCRNRASGPARVRKRSSQRSWLDASYANDFSFSTTHKASETPIWKQAHRNDRLVNDDRPAHLHVLGAVICGRVGRSTLLRTVNLTAKEAGIVDLTLISMAASASIDALTRVFCGRHGNEGPGNALWMPIRNRP